MTALLQTIFLGIIEGLTEFLPISSTGHMILCEWGMRIELDGPGADPFWKLFTVFIQIGAILAVVVYFRQRIADLLRGRRSSQAGLTPLEVTLAAGQAAATAAPQPSASLLQQQWTVWMVLLATVPVLIVGYLFHRRITETMMTPAVIITSLAVGGLAMILIELLPLPATTEQIERISWKQALGIGLAQILAVVFPGTSRAAATIMGGMVAGLSRPAATEFSFFLAIPAMFAACGYDLLKNRRLLLDGNRGLENALLLTIGTIVSFLVAWVVIAAFMGYVRRHNFIPFAVYRILLAGGALVWYLHLPPA